MKSIQAFSLLAGFVLSVGPVDAKPIPGPQGGRILTDGAPYAEFVVDAERRVVITLYDSELNPVPVSSQVATVIAEAPAGKAKLECVHREGRLVSTESLPAGDGYRIVIQLREDVGARPTNYRLVYHAERCSGCSRAEYACVCEETGGDHGDHGH